MPSDKAVKSVSFTAEPPAPSEIGKLAEAVGASFSPSADQRKIKARFWTLMQSAPFGTRPEKMGPEEIIRKVRAPALANWWKVPGFKDWFLNHTEHQERLEYLFDLALNAAEDILCNTDPKAQSARVNMVKTIAELARKMPTKQQTVVLDREVANMSEDQLREFIARAKTQIVDAEEPAQLEGDVE
jgi:hypothetical protein